MEKRFQYCLQRSEEMLHVAEHWLASDLSVAGSFLSLAISWLEQARAAVRSAEEEK